MPSQMFSHVANSKAVLRAPIVVVSLLIYAKKTILTTKRLIRLIIILTNISLSTTNDSLTNNRNLKGKEFPYSLPNLFLKNRMKNDTIELSYRGLIHIAPICQYSFS